MGVGECSDIRKRDKRHKEAQNSWITAERPKRVQDKFVEGQIRIRHGKKDKRKCALWCFERKGGGGESVGLGWVKAKEE